jgi:hypothetical protein
MMKQRKYLAPPALKCDTYHNGGMSKGPVSVGLYGLLADIVRSKSNGEVTYFFGDFPRTFCKR